MTSTARPEASLEVLRRHDAELQKCVYCPKLCRAACPVSQHTGSEAVTPWGKMSTAYFMARGEVPRDRDHAALAWACTGCQACRERCDHDNDVAEVLGDARAAFFSAGLAPPAIVEAASQFDAACAECAQQVERLQPRPPPGAAVAVLIGCSYLRHHRAVARAALEVAERVVGGAVRVLRSCCGLPLYEAGDRVGFRAAAARLMREAAQVDRILVVDADCAHTLAVDYPRLGFGAPRVSLLVDAISERIDLLPAAALAVGHTDVGPFRYHDPCRLGRGLRKFDAPRRILDKLLGEPPAEFQRARQVADCSGGGGMLPIARPVAARQIAAERIAEHERLGGGRIVTACGESLRSFLEAGAAADDLVMLVAQAFEGRGNGR